jgi:hypothetical protein
VRGRDQKGRRRPQGSDKTAAHGLLRTAAIGLWCAAATVTRDRPDTKRRKKSGRRRVRNQCGTYLED